MSAEPRVSTWAAHEERGARPLLLAAWWLLRLSNRRVLTPVVRLTTLYFFVAGRRARAASREYLERLAATMPELGVRPTWRTSLAHFHAFGDAVLDKVEAWSGRLHREDVVFDDYARFDALANGGRGVVILGSHLGNLEVCRALASAGGRVRLNVLVHTKHADKINDVLRRAGADQIQLVQVTELDAGMALTLRERAARGEWVVIAADRVPVHGGRSVDVQFLGRTAPLPLGPYLLAALIDAPVHLLFCLRRNGRPHVYLEPFAERLELPRATRIAAATEAAQRFAARLEHYVRLAPLEWFNFYPFWKGDHA